MMNKLIDITERGLVPTPLVRMGIRRLCADRLQSLAQKKLEQPKFEAEYAQILKMSPMAIETDAANQQHYEVPADFYVKVLGPQRKYSCAYWPEDCKNLAEAEEHALQITMDRAEIKDGMKILELGCGWGSLTLAMATRFPNAQITAISNSASQRLFIEEQARQRNFKNIKVLTKNVALLEDLGSDQGRYDRVVSIEMFEHFRNYELLLGRIRDWLNAEGKVFIHIFTHREFPYLFETEGDDNWMGKYFFTGGQMPSHTLMAFFQRDLKLEKQWSWNGVHYQKTSEAWLKNADLHRHEIIELFEKVYGKADAVRWFNRWRIFFLAVAELFGYRQGTEWGVSHYLFTKNSNPSV